MTAMSSVAVRMLRDSLEMRLRSVEIRRGPVIRHHSLLPSKTPATLMNHLHVLHRRETLKSRAETHAK